MLRKSFGWLALLAVLASAIGHVLAEPAKTQVETAIAWVRAEDRPGRDGLATFWDGNKYVQCRGVNGSDLYCEAAGSLMQVSLGRVLTPERVGRLAALGWILDPSFGNYVRTFGRDTPSEDVAEQILAALQQGYDADLPRLQVRRHSIAGEACPPRNGPSQPLAGMINDAARMAPFALRACAYKPEANEAQQKLGPGSTAADLIRIHGPRLTAEIGRLRANKHRRVFAVFDTGLGYVQCQPHTNPDAFYCKAQSADSWPALAVVLTPERIARLHAAGFADPGRAPNYSKTYPADTIDDSALAAELLTLLYDIYGYYGASALKVTTERTRSGRK